MGESRAENVILAVLEVVGLLTSLYGLYHQYTNNVSSMGMLYCSTWYILGGVSNLLGLVALWLEDEDDEAKDSSQTILQYHYLSGWLSVILGYPLMVNYTWLMLYPTKLAHLHLLLTLIPVITWIAQSSNGIVRTTQFCTLAAASSHFFICFMADDMWGYISAAIMVVNIIALSTPTKYSVWAFNSRELFVIGLVATSYCMNQSILTLADPRKKLKSLW